MKRVERTGLVLAAACAFATVSALPSLAYACPVCFAAQNEAARIAFLGTTVFLTALPVLMIGAVIYWLASRSAEEPEAESTSATSTAPEVATDDARLGA